MESTGHTLFFDRGVHVCAAAGVAGPAEGKGPLGEAFDVVLTDDRLGEQTFERGEKRMLMEAARLCLGKGKLDPENCGCFLCGDLLNQIGGYRPNALCAASSHFSTAERQYRFPLEMGTTTPPSAQRTATGAGAVLVSGESVPGSPLQHVRLKSATIGRVIDMGITDGSNMGAAMAPAAYDSICRHLLDTGRAPEAYDAIYTGDLGRFGRQMLLELFEREGLDLSKKHFDCGEMLFSPEQGYQCGGSGCGCSAIVLACHVLPRLEAGSLRRVLFLSTGALLSPLTCNQGESIPGIAHVIELEREA